MDENREWDLLAALREFRLLEERRAGGSLQAGERPRWEELLHVLGKHAPLLAPLPAAAPAEPLVLVPVQDPEPTLQLDQPVRGPLGLVPPVEALPPQPVVPFEQPVSPAQPVLLLGQPASPARPVLQLDRPAPVPAIEQPVPLQLVAAAPTAARSLGGAPAIEQPVPLALFPTAGEPSPSPPARSTMPFFIAGAPPAPPVAGEAVPHGLGGPLPMEPAPGSPSVVPTPLDLGSPPAEADDAILLTELADQTKPPRAPAVFDAASGAQPLLPIEDPRAALFGGTLRSPTVLEGRHEVALQMQDGKLKRGLLHDPDLEDAHLDLFPMLGGAPERIRADEVRAIFFVLAAGQSPPPPEGRRVSVTFEDGRQLRGYRPESGPAESGFFLVPGDSRTNTARIYVFLSAVKSLTET